jgi:hypothetical protein
LSSSLGTAANNLATLSLIFARWTIADASDGIDSEESLLFTVSVVLQSWYHQLGEQILMKLPKGWPGC